MDGQDSGVSVAPVAVAPMAPAEPARPPLRPPTGERRKELVEHRNRVYDLDYEASNEYDKLLSTLAAGALTVSVGFFKDTLVPQPVILAAWVLFAGTLMVALLAFRPTREMLAAEVESTDAMLAGEEEISRKRVEDAQALVRRLNRLALRLFFLGMGFQVLFLILRFA